MTDVMVEPRTSEAHEPPAPHLGWAVAGLSAAAGIIHIAMAPTHGGSGLIDPLGFAAAGLFQLVVAGAILAQRDGRRLYQLTILGNLAIVGMWAWSRTQGMPYGAHRGIVEDVTLLDGTCAALEVAAVLVAARLLLAPTRTSVGRLAPTLAAVGALALATVVITSPEAAEHGGSATPAAPLLSDHDQYMADIDAERCDTAFNPPAYWEEAEELGIDTYQGGAMDPTAHGAAPAAAGGDGHAHSHGAAAAAPTSTTTTTPDPTGGRGSEGLDDLISATSKAGGGEVAAAQLVNALSDASDADYDAWLWWLKSTGTLTAGHDHAAGAGDGGAHGAHIGPQPWVAMTNRADCDRLADELALARATALSYPTAADAMAAGWHQVTPYVSGIAAHYIKSELVDGKFQIDQPEMILYDGNTPEARVVGLSYYLWHEGDAEPVSGFTGANDHFHRHIGLCNGPGGVIGDSTLTKEECAARGGVKAEGSKGWMSHAWVVPGCESPWGVFSGASPVLDLETAYGSATDGGGCASSAVRDRYGMADPEPIKTLTGG